MTNFMVRDRMDWESAYTFSAWASQDLAWSRSFGAIFSAPACLACSIANFASSIGIAVICALPADSGKRNDTTKRPINTVVRMISFLSPIIPPLPSGDFVQISVDWDSILVELFDFSFDVLDFLIGCGQSVLLLLEFRQRLGQFRIRPGQTGGLGEEDGVFG